MDKEKTKAAFRECGSCGKDAICEWCGYAPFDCANEFIEKIQAENAKLRECVEYYAETYFGSGVDPTEEAVQCLKEIEGE